MFRKTTWGGGLLLWCSLIPQAWGHARLDAPIPRDSSDSHKDPSGPCGGVPRGDKNPAPYIVGQALTVEFTETVKHPGCFVISFSPAGDQGFSVIGKVAHNNAPAPAVFRTTVNLPLVCDQCTLQLRQIMMNSEPATLNDCPPANPALYTSYYSCADLHVKPSPMFDLPPPDPADLAATRDAGPAPADLRAAPADLAAPPPPASGCQATGAAAPGAGAALLLLMPLWRRRRRGPA